MAQTAPIELFIPRTVPSLNKWDNLSISTKKKIKDDWLKEFLAQRPFPLRTLTKCRIEITRGYVRHPLDPDNLISKPLMDALTKAGMIEDDNPKVVISYETNQRKQKQKDVGTLIRIWELS